LTITLREFFEAGCLVVAGLDGLSQALRAPA
jgi:hypothetical protein